MAPCVENGVSPLRIMFLLSLPFPATGEGFKPPAFDGRVGGGRVDSQFIS
jgi:hypothetical protein